MATKPESPLQPSPKQELLAIGAAHLALRLSTDPAYADRVADEAWNNLSEGTRGAISALAARSFPEDLHGRDRETRDIAALFASVIEFIDLPAEIDADLIDFYATINDPAPEN